MKLTQSKYKEYHIQGHHNETEQREITVDFVIRNSGVQKQHFFKMLKEKKKLPIQKSLKISVQN